MSILNKGGDKVFPSWVGLLRLAANELMLEKKEKLANGVEAVLDLNDYIQAADYARQGLKGGLWSQFFEKHFDVDFNSIDEKSIDLPRSIWSLSDRIVTLNYDRVMKFACPDENVVEIDNSTKVELANFQKGSNKSPAIWHLHGRIGNVSEIIFTSEGYKKLYNDTDQDYIAAISILKDIFRQKQIVFIGCSLDDAELIRHLTDQHNIFDGNSGPHYALIHKDSVDKIKENIFGSPIELVTFEGYGRPLIDLINDISNSVEKSRGETQSPQQREAIVPVAVGAKEINHSTNLEKLKQHCAQYNEIEIKKVANRKYIKDLYVIRDVESTLKALLINDDILANRLTAIADYPFNIFAKAKKELGEATSKIKALTKNKLDNSAVKEVEDTDKLKLKIELENKVNLLNKKIECSVKIDQKLKEILSNATPCAGVNRPLFVECEILLKKLQEMTVESDLQLVLKSLDVIQPASKFITVIVDRAGGGKTNLLCHLTNINSELEPTVFLGGRVNIASDDSLIITLADALGANSECEPYEYISRVNQLLEKCQVHATIFIDGINENRGINKLNGALNKLCEALESSRFRFIFSCRDIYWSFFEDSIWVKSSNIVEGNLYSFSKREQEFALEAYLKYFNIVVNLGSLAIERCRHPLLLRFFCEAYSDSNLEKINLGNIPDIRLKPLFDDYWVAKIEKNDNSNHKEKSGVEEMIYKLVSYILKSNEASLTTDLIPRVTGTADLKSEDSLYLGLLDEDIIIEEDPTADINIRKVVFVYEEFMEYAAARFLQQEQKNIAPIEMDNHFAMLNKKVKDLVNVLGIAEYLCAFHLDNKNFKIAFRLVLNMAQSGSEWLPIVSNIFKKYDAAPTMIIQISTDDITTLVDMFTPEDQKVNLQGVKIVLEAIGERNKGLMAEMGVLILYSIILPKTFSFCEIVNQEVPEHLIIQDSPPTDSQKKRTLKLIKIIARLFGDIELNTIRNGYWKSWAKKSEYVGLNDRSELIKALPGQLTVSSRRNSILTLACNGLVDKDVKVRRACALVTQDLKSEFARKIRNSCRKSETDMGVIDLLRDNV